MGYAVFISYKHSDTSRAHAVRLEAALKRYAKPLWRPPLAIFRDERVLRPGDDLPKELRRALEASAFLVYLASKEAAKSEWIQDELRIWCRDLGRADRLLIVHIGDSIVADRASGSIAWSQTDALPDLLRPFMSSIPVWTSLSWATTDPQRDLNNVDYKKAINALVARLRGKQPGEMNDEEVLTHRRNIRLRNALFATVIVFAVVAAYFGDRARRDRDAAEDSARRARESAAAEVVSRKRAEASAKDANDQRRIADGERDTALVATKQAEQQRQRADQQRAVAEQQRTLAEARARSVELAEAFRNLDRGTESLRLGNADQAHEQFDATARRLEGLHLDPVMARHAQLAVDLRLPDVQPIVAVNEGVSFLRVSKDGDLIAVVYDYQNFGGSPEPTDIPDWTAAGIYRVSTRQWEVQHSIASVIGSQVYGLSAGAVVGLEPPSNLIVRSTNGTSEVFERLSLADGRRTPCSPRDCAEYARLLERGDDTTLPKALAPFVEPKALFATLPKDGIDVEYGPRRVDQVFVGAPDRRTAIVGTYEGKLLLIDLAGGMVREGHYGPIFAAAYQRDGARAFVADGQAIYRVETSTWPGLREATAPLRRDPARPQDDEDILAADVAGDGSILAFATKRRILTFTPRDNQWSGWSLPAPIAGAAALRVDPERHLVDLVADDGTLLSVDVRSRALPVSQLPSPTGGQPVAAWLDPDRRMVWLSTRTSAGGVARVVAVALPGRTAPRIELPVKLVVGRGSFRDESPIVHSLARLDNAIVLFYGDGKTFELGNGDLRDERMAVVSLDTGQSLVDRVVFPSTREVDNLNDVLLGATHVERVLPGSRVDRVLAFVGGTRAVTAIGADGTVAPALGTVASADFIDQDQTHSLGVETTVAPDVQVAIRHLASGTMLRYQVPWSTRERPQFATVTPGGRQIAVVGVKGHLLFVDVTSLNARASASTLRPLLP